MSKQAEPGSAFAPASGYATAAVDAALRYVESPSNESMSARIIAAEVRRLQAALDFRGHGVSTYNKLCQAIVALPCCPLAGLIGEAAQELAAHESHNEELSGALKKEDPNA